MPNALRELGKAAAWAGEGERVRAIYEELAELAARIGDEWNGAIALNNLGDLALHDGDWERVVELCGQSSRIRRELGDRWGSALALTNVSLAELQLGRLEDAARSAQIALEDSLAIGGTMVVAAGLDNCGIIASALGRAAEVACVLGASDRLREELGTVREAFEGGLVEKARAWARESLGDQAFAVEAEQGQAMSVEEAVTYARTAVSTS